MAEERTSKEALIQDAMRAGNHRTKREAIRAALRDYVKTKRRLGLLDLVGQLDYDPAYDYKAARRRDRRRLVAD